MTKHMKIDCHLTCHHFQHNILTLHFVPSFLEIANLFTKWHPLPHFWFLVGKLLKLLAAASWVYREKMLRVIYLVLFSYYFFSLFSYYIKIILFLFTSKSKLIFISFY